MVQKDCVLTTVCGFSPCEAQTTWATVSSKSGNPPTLSLEKTEIPSIITSKEPEKMVDSDPKLLPCHNEVKINNPLLLGFLYSHAYFLFECVNF